MAGAGATSTLVAGPAPSLAAGHLELLGLNRAAAASKQASPSSRYRGVSRQKAYWRARLSLGGAGEQIIGDFVRERDAALAYDLVCIRAGAFGRLNFHYRGVNDEGYDAGSPTERVPVVFGEHRAVAPSRPAASASGALTDVGRPIRSSAALRESRPAPAPVPAAAPRAKRARAPPAAEDDDARIFFHPLTAAVPKAALTGLGPSTRDAVPAASPSPLGAAPSDDGYLADDDASFAGLLADAGADASFADLLADAAPASGSSEVRPLGASPRATPLLAHTPQPTPEASPRASPPPE
jgi:hypothetical protein